MDFQRRRSSNAAGGRGTSAAPMESYQQAPLINSATQQDASRNPDFGNFSFSYQGLPDGMAVLDEQYIVSGQGPHSDHGSSIGSLQRGPRASFDGGIAGGHVGHASVSGGSEEASPNSNRGGGGYNDDFAFNGGAVPGDGSDLGARSREEKADPSGVIPPWSELKTKAGKERKRLPLACIACRRKKIRCSGEKPACKHCLRSRIPCVYKVTTRKAAPRTDYMAMLDKRLKRMEDRIIKIVPKEEQDATVIVTRATVKPAMPGTVPARPAAAKKRGAEEAFGAELDNWSKSVSHSTMDAASKSSSLMIQEAEESKLLSEGAEALPSKDIQEHLSEVFFENLYGQTYHLLHKPSYMRKLKAGALPPVLILAVCGISARFSTHPKVNSTPAFLRGEDWASEARDICVRRYEWPNITILTCLLILGLHEFGTCQGGRSWSLGGQAIRMAYALQLHRDLDHDPLKRNGSTPLSFIDREIRRRTMWACFLMDRFNSSGTDRPTFIREENMKIPLPIKEKYFQLNMPGPTENLKGEVLQAVATEAGELSNPKENMGVAAHMIRAIALWGRVINYLNLGGKEEDQHPMWHPESGYSTLIQQTETFADALPEDLKYTPENLHTHETDGLASQFLFLHVSIQQNILFMNRFAVPGISGGRAPKDVPKEFMIKAGEKAFNAANSISDLIRDGESYFVTAPFTGYCAFLSSTVHVFGVFSNNAEMEETSKRNLATNVKYLAKMKRYWGMFHFMSENLKDQYRSYADASRQGTGSKDNPGRIFQYGDWFDQYPHGVSQSDFEDPAAVIKKEKGDDAVLEQKSDYHTVEEFFHTMSPHQSQEASRIPKRKPKKRSSSMHHGQLAPVNTNVGNMAHNSHIPHSAQSAHSIQQLPHSYNQMSPVTPGHMYQQQHQQSPYYQQEPHLHPPHQQGILPQLDRQLVFGAYAGGDPSSGMSQNMMDGGNVWDVQMNGMTGFFHQEAQWQLPFNMEPPEIGAEADIFNTMGGPAGYGVQGGNMGGGGG